MLRESVTPGCPASGLGPRFRLARRLCDLAFGIWATALLYFIQPCGNVVANAGCERQARNLRFLYGIIDPELVDPLPSRIIDPTSTSMGCVDGRLARNSCWGLTAKRSGQLTRQRSMNSIEQLHYCLTAA